jgi:hypothetical protein
MIAKIQDEFWVCAHNERKHAWYSSSHFPFPSLSWFYLVLCFWLPQCLPDQDLHTPFASSLMFEREQCWNFLENPETADSRTWKRTCGTKWLTWTRILIKASSWKCRKSNREEPLNARALRDFWYQIDMESFNTKRVHVYNPLDETIHYRVWLWPELQCWKLTSVSRNVAIDYATVSAQ